MKETWKCYAKVPSSAAKRWPAKSGDHQNLWWVSNLGNFKMTFSWKEGERHQIPSRSGGFKGEYLHISTPSGANVEHFCHRIVASQFIPNPENKRCVNHINSNKHDNRVSNLEWVTHKENMQHWAKMKKLSNIY